MPEQKDQVEETTEVTEAPQEKAEAKEKPAKKSKGSSVVAQAAVDNMKAERDALREELAQAHEVLTEMATEGLTVAEEAEVEAVEKPQPVREGMAMAGMGARRKGRRNREQAKPPTRNTAKVYPDKPVAGVDVTTFKGQKK